MISVVDHDSVEESVITKPGRPDLEVPVFKLTHRRIEATDLLEYVTTQYPDAWRIDRARPEQTVEATGFIEGDDAFPQLM
jgi:hypothetical protein